MLYPIEYSNNLKTLEHFSKISAKCAVLKIVARKMDIKAHAYPNCIEFPHIREHVMNLTHVEITDKSTSTIIRYHFFDMYWSNDK